MKIKPKDFASIVFLLILCCLPACHAGVNPIATIAVSATENTAATEQDAKKPVKIEAWLDLSKVEESKTLIFYGSVYNGNVNATITQMELTWPDKGQPYGMNACYCQGGYGRSFCFIDLTNYEPNTTIQFRVVFPYLDKTYVRYVDYVYDLSPKEKLLLYGIEDVNEFILTAN